jgi:hypothetical protein
MQETDTHTFSSDQAATSFFLAEQIFKSSNVKESLTNMHEEGKKIWTKKKKTTTSNTHPSDLFSKCRTTEQQYKRVLATSL